MLNRKLFISLFNTTTVIVFVICSLSDNGIISHYSSKPLPLSIENRTVADVMSQKIRILCWIMTHPRNHWKAMHVKATWGTRCNILLFMSTEEDERLPTVKLLTEEGKEYLWGKTKAALKYIYENYREEADWFLKTDDDTYVVVENLRHLLSYFQTEMALYIGARVKFYGGQVIPVLGYMDGGAGYVLSRSALDQFMNVALKAPLCNVSEVGQEDFELGRCFSYCEVVFVDSHDALGRSWFHPLPLISHIIPDYREWYWMRLFYPWQLQKGLNCCSEYSISFHRVPPYKMYELEYFVYKLRPYGISYTYKCRSKKPLNIQLSNKKEIK